MLVKAVILIGGPAKGTRFRPLTFDIPKPLFPIAGVPLIAHHVEECSRVPNLKEILIIGFYPAQELDEFIHEYQRKHRILIRYLQEFTALGTAGGLYHFRDQILAGKPTHIFVINGDVACDMNLASVLAGHVSLEREPHSAAAVGDASGRAVSTMLVAEVTRTESLNYGVAVVEERTRKVLHFVEKPSTFVASTISCGVYLFTPTIFEQIRGVYERHLELSFDAASRTGRGAAIVGGSEPKETITLETEVLVPLAAAGALYAHRLPPTAFWSPVKSAAAAIYANRHYLRSYRQRNPQLLARGKPRSRNPSLNIPSGHGVSPLPVLAIDGVPVVEGPAIIENVYIHPSAHVDPTASLGPNVSIGEGCVIGAGVRVRDSIILKDATLAAHSFVARSIVGWGSRVGEWCRIEGTSNEPNPNAPNARMGLVDLFNDKGQLNPSVTVIGSGVNIENELFVLNTIVLPQKRIQRSYRNQIIL